MNERQVISVAYRLFDNCSMLLPQSQERLFFWSIRALEIVFREKLFLKQPPTYLLTLVEVESSLEVSRMC